MAKKKAKPTLTPTDQQFQALNGAYQYFNKTLFKNQLPHCILNFSRLKGAHGFLAPDRWKRVGQEAYAIHEISLTPATLYRTPLEIYSTLVHEMVHLWQWEFGNPSRRGYHNKEWAAKMTSVGLIPSDTGKVGGKQTGQRMTHYIEENGRYEKAFKRMAKKLTLPFTALDAELMKRKIEGKTDGSGGGDDERAKRLRKLRPPSRNKTKYSCPCCKNSLWGKPDLHVICGDCKLRYTIVS